jgi:hypothetical protein
MADVSSAMFGGDLEDFASSGLQKSLLIHVELLELIEDQSFDLHNAWKPHGQAHAAHRA